jgi:hypothetical protein
MCVNEEEVHLAGTIAARNNFDVVPILCKGAIPKFWSYIEKRTFSISKRHRLCHDATIEEV